MWRREVTNYAAARFSGRFRADMQLKPMNPTFLPSNDSCYHASVVGHLSQRHLQYLLQHPDPDSGGFAEYAVGQLVEALKVDASNNTRVVLLTLKVYHSRQAGFSDDELDKLGAVFDSFPSHTRFWLWDSPLQPATLICEPVWQLLSPSKQVSCMYWDVQDPECIDAVAELSEVLAS